MPVTSQENKTKKRRYLVMATNYTLSEAAKIAAEKTDGEAIFNLGRRYPFLMASLNTVIAKAGQDAVDLLSYMPEKLSANKVNMAMKAAMLGDSNGEEDDEDGEGASAAADKKAKAAERRKARRAAAKKTSAPVEADEDEESDSPYDGMNAMELFKLCKERGIAAKPKRSVKFYVDLLTKADAEGSEDGDDWDDGDEEEKAPAKKTPAKKAPAKKAPAKKAAAKKAETADDEDDDEDWDI
jgi:hypothetical protein